MRQPFASTAPAFFTHSYENEIFGEYARFLDEVKKPTAPPRHETPSSSRRKVVLVLVAVCGAALFALAQVDVKEALLSGRSVAHATSRRHLRLFVTIAARRLAFQGVVHRPISCRRARTLAT